MLALVPFKITTTPESPGTVGVGVTDSVTDDEDDSDEKERPEGEGEGKSVEDKNEVEKIEDMKKDELRLVDKEDK